MIAYSSFRQKWQNVPNLIFGDIMMMTDLEDLQKCRQICKCWKEMISQLTKYRKNTIRRKIERLVEQIREAGEDELRPGGVSLSHITRRPPQYPHCYQPCSSWDAGLCGIPVA